MSFTGQTAVVSGGTRGIGKAISLDLLAQGARVFATYLGNDEAAEALREESGPHGEQLHFAKFDVADADGVRAFWEERESDCPDGVQVLVQSSGIRRDGVLAMMPEEQWRAVLETNLTGSYLMAKYAVQNMLRQRYGRIVFITSPAREHGFEGQANYAASKAGQVGLMRSLAREVAKRSITVNCVSPGFVDTELIADLDEKTRAGYERSVPLRRFGRTEEIAYAVRCLAAREASYITGTTLEVAGGL